MCPSWRTAVTPATSTSHTVGAAAAAAAARACLPACYRLPVHCREIGRDLKAQGLPLPFSFASIADPASSPALPSTRAAPAAAAGFIGSRDKAGPITVRMLEQARLCWAAAGPAGQLLGCCWAAAGPAGPAGRVTDATLHSCSGCLTPDGTSCRGRLPRLPLIFRPRQCLCVSRLPSNTDASFISQDGLAAALYCHCTAG